MSKKTDKVIVRCVGESSTHVTGSSYLVECPTGEKILLDSGMFQVSNSYESYKVNKQKYDFKPKEITATLVSHLHFDHYGMVPKLYRNGYNGKIYVSKESIGFAKPMLEDSVKIMEREIQSYARRYKKQFDLIYDYDDVEKAVENLVGCETNVDIYITDNVWFKYIEAHHIWGSKQIILYVRKPNNNIIKIAFTGDLGNEMFEQPFTKDFESIIKCNMLIGEATYNNPLRSTKPFQREKDISLMKDVIEQTISSNGIVLIPTFALQRIEVILYYLYQNFKDSDIQFVLDSPLGLRLIEEGYNQFLDDKWKSILDELLSWKNLKIIRTIEESKSCVEDNRPKVVLASSGMMNQGRCVLYLKKIISRSNCCVLTCGYMAEGSIGYKIEKCQKTITIDQKTYVNRCNIKSMTSFSGHAQYEQLMKYYTSIANNGCNVIWIVHSNQEKENFVKELRNRIEKILKTTKVVSVNKDTVCRL